MLIGRINETNVVNSKFSRKDTVALSAPFTFCGKFLGLFDSGLSVLRTNHLTSSFNFVACIVSCKC